MHFWTSVLKLISVRGIADVGLKYFPGQFPSLTSSELLHLQTPDDVGLPKLPQGGPQVLSEVVEPTVQAKVAVVQEAASG